MKTNDTKIVKLHFPIVMHYEEKKFHKIILCVTCEMILDILNRYTQLLYVDGE